MDRETTDMLPPSPYIARPFVRYRVPDRRSWNAQYVPPNLVSYGTIRVDHFLYTLQEWSRCVDVSNSKAIDRE